MGVWAGNNCKDLILGTAGRWETKRWGCVCEGDDRTRVTTEPTHHCHPPPTIGLPVERRRGIRRREDTHTTHSLHSSLTQYHARMQNTHTPKHPPPMPNVCHLSVCSTWGSTTQAGSTVTCPPVMGLGITTHHHHYPPPTHLAGKGITGGVGEGVGVGNVCLEGTHPNCSNLSGNTSNQRSPVHPPDLGIKPVQICSPTQQI